MKSRVGVDGIARPYYQDPEPCPLPEGCQLVLEGYPRSANTFVAFAFERTNPSVIFKHHTHSALTILRGVEAGIPCAALVRDPLDACASFLIYDQTQTPPNVLGRWLRFHQALIPVLDRVRLISFEDATSPRLLEHFGALGFSGKLPDTFSEWHELETMILADLRSRAGLLGWGTARVREWSRDDTARVRMSPAPMLARREMLEEAKNVLRAEPDLVPALDLYQSLSTS